MLRWGPYGGGNEHLGGIALDLDPAPRSLTRFPPPSVRATTPSNGPQAEKATTPTSSVKAPYGRPKDGVKVALSAVVIARVPGFSL